LPPAPTTSPKESPPSWRNGSRASKAVRREPNLEAAKAGTTTAQHPIRLINHDDLHRNRLTVFFRLILAIPLFLWAILWGVIAYLPWLVNCLSTLLMAH